MKRPNPARLLLAYAALVAVLALAIHQVAGFPTMSGSGGAPPGPLSLFLHGLTAPVGRFLLQLLVILAAAHGAGRLLRRFGQPAVMGEILAGILLGPSLFGWLFPQASAFLFAPGTLAPLEVVSQLGLLLFMFSVGMHARPEEWKRQGPAVIFISHSSIFIPFTLGIALAPYLGRYAPGGVDPTAFALFCGISLSITAFPVLARMLHDRGISGLPESRLALSCAAIDDVTAWVVLAGIVALTKGQGLESGLYALGGLIVGVVVLVKLIAPLLERLVSRNREAGHGRAIAAMITLFSSALYFEAVGVHALFGAFLAGAVFPKSEAAQSGLPERLEYFSGLFLLPVFFAMTGLRTSVTLLDSAPTWAACAVIIGAAVAGKLGGTALAARWCGIRWRNAAFLGVLMNTRGLLELIVLNIGLDLGIISPPLFTMMVIMALVTTFMTAPCLNRLKPPLAGASGSPT